MTKKDLTEKVLHKKPTIKELDENIEKDLEELDKLEAEGKKDIEEDTDNPEQEEEVTPEEEETPEEKDNLERERLENKLKASSKEAKKLFEQNEKNKQVNEAYEKASQLAPPTDEEMKEKFIEWDDLSDFERDMARKTELTDRRFQVVEESTRDFRKLTQWHSSVDNFIDDPINLSKNPLLEGREEGFKSFAKKSGNKGVAFDVLVPAFLYIDKPAVAKKGSMMETGTGGPIKTKPKSDKISLEEADVLREKDYAKYKEMVIKDKIETIA